MKKRIAAILLVAIMFAIITPFDVKATTTTQHHRNHLVFDYGGGYARDFFNWSIDDNGRITDSIHFGSQRSGFLFGIERVGAWRISTASTFHEWAVVYRFIPINFTTSFLLSRLGGLFAEAAYTITNHILSQHVTITYRLNANGTLQVVNFREGGRILTTRITSLNQTFHVVPSNGNDSPVNIWPYTDSLNQSPRIERNAVIQVTGSTQNAYGNTWYRFRRDDQDVWIFSGNVQQGMPPSVNQNNQQSGSGQQPPVGSGSSNQQQQPPSRTVVITEHGEWSVSLPREVTVELFPNATATARTHIFEPGTVRGWRADRRVTLSDGTIRFRLVLPNGQIFYVNQSSDMSVNALVDRAGIHLIFDANGGVGGPISDFAIADDRGMSRVYIPNVIPSRDGYIFSHWLRMNPSIETVRPVGIHNIFYARMIESITFVAQWTPAPVGDFTMPPMNHFPSIFVHYDLNGGHHGPQGHNVSGQLLASNNTVFSFDYNISNIIPIKSGYEFAGWLRGSWKWDSGASVSNQYNTSSHGRVHTWVAQWVPATTLTHTLTIQYNANGGFGVPSNHDTNIRADGSVLFRLADYRVPQRTGYEFLGWRLGNSSFFGIDIPGQMIELGFEGDTHNLTYYAQWQPVSATQQGQTRVLVNGARLLFEDQQPTLVDGRTLVPARGVFEALGFEVYWEQATSTAVLTNATHQIRITVGQTTFFTNGIPHQLDVPAQLIGGRTMIPLRLPLESVGIELGWDGTTNAVIISTR